MRLKQIQPEDNSSEQRYVIRYVVLTFVLTAPLLWSFVTLRNTYPSAAWTVMMSGGSVDRSWTYYVVRGETVSGEVIDLRPAHLTNALYGRTWSLVRAAVNNDALKLEAPHPENARLIESAGAIEMVPRAARVGELLRAWGGLYNAKLPATSPARLKAVRVDVYRWSSGRFEDFEEFVETWRKEL